MTPKQKVVSIRLANLIAKNYVYAKGIGIEVLVNYEKVIRRLGGGLMGTFMCEKCFAAMEKTEERNNKKHFCCPNCGTKWYVDDNKYNNT